MENLDFGTIGFDQVITLVINFKAYHFLMTDHMYHDFGESGVIQLNNKSVVVELNLKKISAAQPFAIWTIKD